MGTGTPVFLPGLRCPQLSSHPSEKKQQELKTSRVKGDTNLMLRSGDPRTWQCRLGKRVKEILLEEVRECALLFWASEWG